MRRTFCLTSITFALALLAPVPALAHPGHGEWQFSHLLHWLLDHGVGPAAGLTLVVSVLAVLLLSWTRLGDPRR